MSPRPPGPAGRIPRLIALAFIRDRINALQRLTAQYGDVVSFNIGKQLFTVLNHPDYVRDVLITRHRMFHKGIGLQRAKLLLGEGLLTSEDGHHQRQRRLLQPAFHRERIAGYGSTMTAYAERATQQWRDGETRDMLQEMSRLTLGIAGKTLFDADVESDADAIGESLGAVLANFNITLLPFGDRLVNWPIPHAIRFRKARGRLDEIVYRLIAERRVTGGTGRDVLSTLVAARDEDDGTGMSDVEIRDEVMTLLLAGHETTANALTWSWYLLSQNQEARLRFESEVATVCATRSPTIEDLPALVYTRAVLTESMRLFPPAYLVGRRALETYAVPNTDLVVPAGTVILLSQYLLHRDPRFWDAPETFRPERWLEGSSSSVPPRSHPKAGYAYFPFGAGPRICIGEQFAWMEGVLVLATIGRRWRLNVAANQKIAVDPIITLRPKHGMRMDLKEWRK
jgi:cytochrome P450